MTKSDSTTVKPKLSTVMTTNGAFDSILLVNEQGTVVSYWNATADVIADYLADGTKADQWSVHDPDGISGASRIEDYGEECGRDGQITNEQRRDFWGSKV